MLVLFKVKNSIGFELRDIEILQNNVKIKKVLKISEYLGLLEDLPVYLPANNFNSQEEYLKQFGINLIELKNGEKININNQKQLF